ncbi:zn 2cys6 transcription factor [Drechmeria coniospora]|uniref:Zn 2cys6 transcription factor n=1 Tax=Drechmeria coniospora TaxID=98403 RepID=A0A151GR88_DRECN|nr:zn 2cys6 transcription factor [Drechmeria coniospora]KYK59603.1 zn 2cys6 transcription factor [Drechmeria coniospora]
MATPADPPWRAAFLSDVERMDSPTFVLSALGQSNGAPLSWSSSSSPPSPRDHPPRPSIMVPRARTVVFRGMWACLPVNGKNPAELNADVFTSYLPTITTDVRMQKSSELVSGDGAGNPVEAVFWAAEAKNQWRLRGRAYLLGPDIDSEAAAPVRAAIKPYMRPRGTGAGTDVGGPWSWSRELTAHFGNLSPLMRGTFKNPPPGTPLACMADQGFGLGAEVHDLDDELARRNFRVVVIVPDEIDRVDLSEPARVRRWSYSRERASEDGWRVTELWP